MPLVGNGRPVRYPFPSRHGQDARDERSKLKKF
jgi:hypothetical protein